jgi:hypothetical protein
MGYLNNEQQLIVDQNGITINSGYISLSGSILTSITVDRLKNISSDVQLQINGFQNQFNTISSTIDNKISAALTNFVNTDQNYISSGIGSSYVGSFKFGGQNKGQLVNISNGTITCTGLPSTSIALNITNGRIRNNDNVIEFRDANHYVGGISPNVDGPMLFGYQGVEIGYSWPTRVSKLIINQSGLVMGGYTLSNAIWGYLSTITSNVQTALSDLQASGRTVQTKIICGPNTNLLTTSINNGNSNNANVVLFTYLFTCRSSNSTLYITFDCKNGVNGGGTDSLTSYITVNDGSTTYTIAKKLIQYGIDNRNCDSILFPISGAFNNNLAVGQRYRISILVFLTATDDTLTLDNNFWNFHVSEIKN